MLRRPGEYARGGLNSTEKSSSPVFSDSSSEPTGLASPMFLQLPIGIWGILRSPGSAGNKVLQRPPEVRRLRGVRMQFQITENVLLRSILLFLRKGDVGEKQLRRVRGIRIE